MQPFTQIYLELQKLPLEKRVVKVRQMHFQMAAYRWFLEQERARLRSLSVVEAVQHLARRRGAVDPT